VTIRLARDDDDAALARIDRLTWTSDVSPSPVPPEGRPFFDDRTTTDDVLVADADGHVVGYVRLGQALPLPSHRHVLEIQGLAVDPDRSGHGTGRLLVEAAVAEAARRGARKVTLRVLGPNTTARRLYERCGFVVEGTLRAEFHLDGRDVDDVLMARQLAPSG
jgi:ribosomal protein S18 acetylase RimI-like enzyme